MTDQPCTCHAADVLHTRACPQRWPAVAQHQAETIAEQADTIRALIAERDAAKDAAEGAYDLAEQYARRAGVDLTRQAALRYVAEYWRLRGDFERSWHRLELFHWDVLALELRLQRHEFPDGWSACQLADAVGAAIGEANPVGSARRQVSEWARPAAPEQMSLDGAP